MRKKYIVLICLIHLVTVLAKSPVVDNIKVNGKSVKIVQQIPSQVEDDDCSADMPFGLEVPSESCSESKSGEHMYLLNSSASVNSARTVFNCVHYYYITSFVGIM